MSKEANLKINEEIKAKEVRLIDSENEQLGIMSLKDALKLASEQNLDLVEVAPTAKPPVCRIIDSGKFRYERQKRAKEVKKKQKVTALKEVKIRPNIEDHDFNVKLKNAQRFLDNGDKVKVTITFRGRELSHPELGRQLLVKMGDLLKEAAIIEREAKLEGKNMIMILSPKSSTTQAN
ncbi:translation initiation factor IF-3 [Selenomonadales bacterium OttesenSCG-928-I06]|nr:translation initiation factor IF-3 [Selenomonadales bacterium OttesenSCG-928-I06]